MITLTKITDPSVAVANRSAFEQMIMVNRKINRSMINLVPDMPLIAHREGLGANDLLSLQSAFRIIAVHGGTQMITDGNPWINV